MTQLVEPRAEDVQRWAEGTLELSRGVGYWGLLLVGYAVAAWSLVIAAFRCMVCTETCTKHWLRSGSLQSRLIPRFTHSLPAFVYRSPNGTPMPPTLAPVGAAAAGQTPRP